MIKSISVGLKLDIVFNSQEFIAKIILFIYFINNFRKNVLFVVIAHSENILLLYLNTIKLYNATSDWF